MWAEILHSWKFEIKQTILREITGCPICYLLIIETMLEWSLTWKFEASLPIDCKIAAPWIFAKIVQKCFLIRRNL